MAKSPAGTGGTAGIHMIAASHRVRPGRSSRKKRLYRTRPRRLAGKHVRLTFSIVGGIAWSVLLAITSLLLPRARALWFLNGVALWGILISVGLNIAARLDGDIAGYFYVLMALQFEIVGAAALVLRLIVRRRID